LLNYSVGERAADIANNRGPPIQVDAYGLYDPLEIARKEFQEKKMPMVIQRVLPNGTVEEWKVHDLQHDG
jgi:DNA-directed RNA polymerase I, II, and III subunit RPABC2